jgi:hypothetical protein
VYDSVSGSGMLYGSTDADDDAEFVIQILGTKTLSIADLVL